MPCHGQNFRFAPKLHSEPSPSPSPWADQMPCSARPVTGFVVWTQLWTRDTLSGGSAYGQQNESVLQLGLKLMPGVQQTFCARY
jgi:hypothetical protein